LLGIAEIIIAKHRNGATDMIQLKFKSEFAKFLNLDDFDAQEEILNEYKVIPSKINKTEKSTASRFSSLDSFLYDNSEEVPF
ncbi:MAG TPA: DnaB-like helicase C-terminal domain-containing protein, partial [Paludibacteraceae bacterium]|nr:DnaB-like helicase C-terminal domain-containing protein [Paludibacteraceae bacterium]